jgi:hypothetical protein
MTELEQALTRLGEGIAFPETPDVAAAVRAQIAARPAPRRLRMPERRTLAVVLVAVLVAVGAAFAVPPARTAILEFFGLRGATVRKVETLPKVSVSIATRLELGRPLPVVEGRPRVKFASLLLPRALGEPDAAYYSTAVPGGKVSLVYEPSNGIPRSRFTGVGVLVTEFDGALEPEFIDKLADQATSIEQLSVNGNRAIWLEGGPHVVLFKNRNGGFGEDVARLAGNTLLVQHGSVLVRIEGAFDRDRAAAIAASLAAD